MLKSLPRVLVVEDNLMNLEIIQSFLAKLNYDCDKASSGAKAINLFLSNLHGYEAVILDIGLPDITGFEVAEKIRQVDSKSAFKKETPIVFITAHVDKQTKYTAKKLCADAFLTKPISFDALENILINLKK